MFFRKRRERLEKEAAEAREQTLRAFDDKYQEALANPDPAARILQLKEMKSAIATVMDMADGKAVSKAKTKWLGGYFGGVLGGSLIIDAITFMLTGVPASSALSVVSSIFIGFMAGDARVAHNRKKNKEENEKMFSLLREKQKAADKSIEETLKTDMREFAKSPRFSELLENIPSLRMKFAEAFKREVDADDISNKPEAPKKKGGFHL